MTMDHIFNTLVKNYSTFPYTYSNTYYNKEVTDAGMTLHIDAPGVKADDINVSLENGDTVYKIGRAHV